MLMARLWQELLYAADIFCAPFRAGSLLDTLLGRLQKTNFMLIIRGMQVPRTNYVPMTAPLLEVTRVLTKACRSSTQDSVFRGTSRRKT